MEPHRSGRDVARFLSEKDADNSAGIEPRNLPYEALFLLMNPRASLLLQESPLQLLPSLAVAIGLNEAVVLQQIYFLQLNPKNGKVLADGERYVYNTYEDWRSVYFPFFSYGTIERVFRALEKRGLLVSCQPEGTRSRRKWYRVGMGAISKLTYGTLADASEDRNLRHSSPSVCGIPLTEITSREEKKETRAGMNPARTIGFKSDSQRIPIESEVLAEASSMNISRACALRFYAVNTFNGWRSGVGPIRYWKKALAAFARADQTRKPKLDKITNNEFWKWARGEFSAEQLEWVSDWVRIYSKRGYVQLNKINGCIEPIQDIRAAVSGYVRWCDEIMPST